VPIHSVERKLAAILAADVMGYSRLMGEDEAGTLARLKEHRRELIDPKISEHKGRIVKTTGDGLLIEFPSVVEAVACAVAVQRGMAESNVTTPEAQRIVLRVGVNLGDIIIGEDNDIHGDGVNVAARLEGIAEPGGICVSGTVRDHIGDRLNLAFEDMGQQTLKNIARPVRAYRVRLDRTGERPGRWWAETSSSLALPDKPSVAVLPFANMSSDPEQEFFADGIAEDVITALSRYPSLFVIARNSTFTYKGRAVEVRQVGRELGVRYVLEGSLRKAGNRIRVTAQLIEAETGNHIWAERYDRNLTDIFAVQEEIAEAVTVAIAPAVADAERQRAMRKPPERLDAWAAYQRGMWHASRDSATDIEIAKHYFRQAIDLDPNFTGGYNGLALAHFIDSGIYHPDRRAELQSASEELARKAVALDPNDAEAHARLGGALTNRGDFVGGLAESERALELCPNLASGHGRRGSALVYSGHPKQGIEALGHAIRLDPHSPLLPISLLQVVIAHYNSGEYTAAVEVATGLTRAFPNFPNTYRFLAAALGQLGRTEDGKQALEKALALSPIGFETYVQRRAPFYRPEDHAHMLDGLRKAGWEG
jgi:adenylate cyclase